MLETIKSWFQTVQEPLVENKWDANTVTMQQPNCPAAPAMNQAVSEQPVSTLFPLHTQKMPSME